MFINLMSNTSFSNINQEVVGLWLKLWKNSSTLINCQLTHENLNEMARETEIINYQGTRTII